MGLITKIVKVKWSPSNKKHYESLGYVWTKKGDEFEVNVDELSKGSNIEIKCICDSCGKELVWKYCIYNNYVKENGETFCHNCAIKTQGIPNSLKTRLNNSKSIAQYFIETYGENALKLYWDYDKNSVDPFDISYKSHKKVWIKCQEKDYHGSYEIACNHIYEGKRCPYCSGKKIHELDSLKQYIVDRYEKDFFNKIWSYKNTINPISIAPYSKTKCWWNCPDGKHEPFERSCDASTNYNYRCPECSKEELKGDTSPLWNPNKSQLEREQSRKISGYRSWRQEVYERDNYTCQCCGDNKGGNLNAHHLNGYNWDKEHRTDIDNEITLCEKCHKEFHDLYGRGNNTKEQFKEFLKKH